MPNVADILMNPVLVVSGLVWLTTELIKQMIGRSQGRRWLDPGGMPSGHAAVTAAAATVIAMTEGLSSPIFALAVVLWGIIVSDAYRVRWSVGEQAVRLNKLSARAKLKPLPVVRGHRPSEVVIGTLFGVAIGATLYFWIYG